MPAVTRTRGSLLRKSANAWGWAVIVVLALAVRSALVVGTDGSSVVTRRSNVGDATLYDTFGWNLATRGVLGVGDRPSAFVPPAYPILIAATYRISGHRPGAVRWVQVVLGTAAVLMLGAFAARTGGRRSGLIVGAAAAIYPYFLYFVPEILTETTFIFCVAGMLLTARILGDSGGVRAGLLFGVFVAWALMTRSIALLFVPGVLVLARPLAAERRSARLIGLALGGLLVVATWTAWVVRNERAVGAPVLFDTHGGFTLYTSQLISTGLPHDEVVRRTRQELGFYRYDIEHGTLPGGPAAEVVSDHRATEKAKQLIRQDPTGYLARVPKNIGRLWLNLDLGEVSGERHGPGLVTIASSVAFFAVLVLGLSGLWSLWRERHIRVLIALVWILAATTAVHGLTHGGKRYRVATIDPVLICSAGLLIDAQLRRRFGLSRRAGNSEY
jgi:4-amino-4-deoxy-L-arabinose transferase-like glycosyltransferase